MKLLERLEAPEFEQVACIPRQIWLRRNKLMFEEAFIPPKKVVQTAVEQLEFHTKVAQGVIGGMRKKSQQVVEVWKAPPMGTMKLNWAVAIDKQRKRMGVGIVVRNHASGVIATQCMMRPYISDPVVAEAIAVWTAAALLR